MTSLVFYWSVTGVFSEEYLQVQFSSSTAQAFKTDWNGPSSTSIGRAL